MGSSTALAVIGRSKPPSPSAMKAGSQLALPSGEIAGDVRLLGVDRRRRLARYELRIANETNGPLIGFVYALETPSARATINWSTIRVPMRTSVALPVEFPISRRRRIQRVVAELHADGAHLTLDAEPPRDATPAVQRFALLAGSLVLAGASFGGYALMHPRAAQYVAPALVATRLPLAKPKKAKIVKPAPKALPPIAVSLAQETVAGGKPIVVRYANDIGEGDVKLLDQDGTERASALIAKRGSSILVAPNVVTPQDFRVIVSAHARSGVREAQIALRIVPAPEDGADDSFGAPSARRPTGRGDSPIALAKTKYRSGDSIRVAILRHPDHFAVALLNDRGETLSRAEVVPGEAQLQFTAPPVDDLTRMVVVATFARGIGEENVIEPVLIRPAH